MNCYRCGCPVEGTRFAPSRKVEGGVYHQDFWNCIKGLGIKANELEGTLRALYRNQREL